MGIKKKHKIEVQEFLSRIVEVEAKNQEEAISKVKKMYQNEEIVLDSDNFVTTEIGEFPKTKQINRGLLSDGNNFYLIEDNFIHFWGLDITPKKIQLNDKSFSFINENELPLNEVCEFNEEVDFRFFELFYIQNTQTK